MREDYAVQDPQVAERYEAHSLSDITPYLGLRARLSQVWLNKWTILLLLVLARLLLLIGSLRDDINDAEGKALKACTSVESIGSTVASMPHYLADGTNALAAKGITKAVDGLQEMLFMSITALEEIFVFVINMMYGTYECLLTFAIGGAAHVAVQIAEDVTGFLNKTLGDIGKDLDNGINSFQSGFNSFLGDLSSIPSIFGAHVTPPQINITSQIDALNHVTLPASINQGLDELNKSIPNFQQVQNFTNTVLELPFEEIKKLLNQTLGVYTFNQSVFPVPAKQSMTFCSDGQGFDDFFDKLYDICDLARKIAIGVILTAAFLACIPFALLEIRRWRSMKERSRLFNGDVHEPMDVVYIISRPITATFGLKIARRFSSPKRQILIRWFWAYITSTPALIVLAIALAGLFSALCQFILLKVLMGEVPALTGEISGFADKVIDSLNNASTTWANQTNHAILTENDKINSDVFGWVNTTTTTLNTTLNSFINETTDIINKTFGNTVLRDPVQQVFNCLIGLKVQSIEKGLTWAHDHAHINFPLFSNDTFSQGVSKFVTQNNSTTNTSNSFLGPDVDPGSEASQMVDDAVNDLTAKLAKSIAQEAALAGAVLLCYLLVLLMGAVWVTYLDVRREKLRAAGGATYAGDIDPDSMATANTTSAPPTIPRVMAITTPLGEQMTGYATPHPGGGASVPSHPAPAYEERGAESYGRFAGGDEKRGGGGPFETPFDDEHEREDEDEGYEGEHHEGDGVSGGFRQKVMTMMPFGRGQRGGEDLYGTEDEKRGWHQ